MGSKRRHADENPESEAAKRQVSFTVGKANLPTGRMFRWF